MSDDAEIMECDVLIVGAGPSGLSAAIKLAQCAQEKSTDVNIIVIEKGSEVGAHILSGCVMETRALDYLIPNWREKDDAPLKTPVTTDSFSLLTRKYKIRLPTPPQMHNRGNYIVSLGNVCRFLAKEAEALGVQIFPGFAAAEAIIEDDTVKGIRTGAFGVDKNGAPKASYQAPMELRAKVTLFAEGCRGSVSEKLMETFNLRDGVDPQTYGIGLKEIWQIEPEKHSAGKVEHSVGWPLNQGVYGGSFLYHMADNQLAIGFVIGLDYQNPHLDPFKEFQRFKQHPAMAKLLQGGKRIAYGARALNEGGYQSIPKLTMPGGCLIGCAAGFLNVAKIKGTHTAMFSGMLAAEAAFDLLQNNQPDMTGYETALHQSWLADELKSVRNIRPAFRFGLWLGLLNAAIDTYIFRGRAPWTMHHHQPDHTALKPADKMPKITYPKADGVLNFDRLSSVYLSNTNHEEDQPAHLTLKDAAVPVAQNLPLYDAPEQRYCPAGVYEIIEEGGQTRLQINAQNCVHCKTCDIKDPTQNIVWTTPEGTGGPNYEQM
jgi:electron-transferring-flavoprotein dehydrogenase